MSLRDLNFGESNELLIGRYNGTAVIRGIHLDDFLSSARTSVGNANGNFHRFSAVADSGG